MDVDNRQYLALSFARESGVVLLAMALACHDYLHAFGTGRAVLQNGNMSSTSSSVQHHLSWHLPAPIWRCRPSSSPYSPFLHISPKPTGVSVGPITAVKILAGGHLREKVRGLAISRRKAGVAAMALTCIALLIVQPAQARQRRNTKAIPIEEYKTNSEGIKYYDLVEGNGPEARKGSTVLVHFDCVYRGLTVVSSRESKILAGNRVIAQPYEFIVGAPPGRERKREFVDNPNGLFSAQASPKPPPALYSITEGMRVGAQRTVIVPPEVGYGKKGMNEIPPDGTFELNVELLQVKSPTPAK